MIQEYSYRKCKEGKKVDRHESIRSISTVMVEFRARVSGENELVCNARFLLRFPPARPGPAENGELVDTWNVRMNTGSTTREGRGLTVQCYPREPASTLQVSEYSQGLLTWCSPIPSLFALMIMTMTMMKRKSIMKLSSSPQMIQSSATAKESKLMLQRQRCLH